MEFFKSLVVNLSATGSAAALCVLAMCIAVVGIWGQGNLATMALSGLQVLGVMCIFRMGRCS
jgi:hypothetical protein